MTLRLQLAFWKAAKSVNIGSFLQSVQGCERSEPDIKLSNQKFISNKHFILPYISNY